MFARPPALLVGWSKRPALVQEWLGHRQVDITLNTYSHVLPGHGRSIASRPGATLHDGEGGEPTEPMDESEREPEDGASG